MKRFLMLLAVPFLFAGCGVEPSEETTELKITQQALTCGNAMVLYTCTAQSVPLPRYFNSAITCMSSTACPKPCTAICSNLR